MAKEKIISLPPPVVPSLSWIDGCPCLSCPIEYNCLERQSHNLCTLIEGWVLGLHSSGTNKKVKALVAEAHVGDDLLLTD